MADFDTNTKVSREELLQRVALMEAIISEDRQDTGRYGWIFVAWGLCYIIASLWSGMGPHPVWAWPICLAITILGVGFGQARQAKVAALRGARTAQSHTLGSVWMAFSGGIFLFVGAAGASHHIGDGVVFIAALCFFLGTVNVTSAAIYRWKMQGLAGAIWWAAGMTALFTSPESAGIAFLVATFLSQIVFGIYLMVLEHRRGGMIAAQSHA